MNYPLNVLFATFLWLFNQVTFSQLSVIKESQTMGIIRAGVVKWNLEPSNIYCP